MADTLHDLYPGDGVKAGGTYYMEYGGDVVIVRVTAFDGRGGFIGKLIRNGVIVHKTLDRIIAPASTSIWTRLFGW